MQKLVFSFTGSFCRFSTSFTCVARARAAVKPGRARGARAQPNARGAHRAAAHEHRGQRADRQVRLLAHQRLEALVGEHAVHADMATWFRLALSLVEVQRVGRGKALLRGHTVYTVSRRGARPRGARFACAVRAQARILQQAHRSWQPVGLAARACARTIAPSQPPPLPRAADERGGSAGRAALVAHTRRRAHLHCAASLPQPPPAPPASATAQAEHTVTRQ
jgi:hypothetical protein